MLGLPLGLTCSDLAWLDWVTDQPVANAQLRTIPELLKSALVAYLVTIYALYFQQSKMLFSHRNVVFSWLSHMIIVRYRIMKYLLMYYFVFFKYGERMYLLFHVNLTLSSVWLRACGCRVWWWDKQLWCGCGMRLWNMSLISPFAYKSNCHGILEDGPDTDNDIVLGSNILISWFHYSYSWQNSYIKYLRSWFLRHDFPMGGPVLISIARSRMLTYLLTRISGVLNIFCFRFVSNRAVGKADTNILAWSTLHYDLRWPQFLSTPYQWSFCSFLNFH